MVVSLHSRTVGGGLAGVLLHRLLNHGSSGAETRFYPKTGKNLLLRHRNGHGVAVPADQTLVARVAASTGLSTAEAERVVEDVVAFYREPVEQYVRRRHAQLKTYGAKNEQIFPRLVEELADRVVAAPALSERQLRRLIYG